MKKFKILFIILIGIFTSCDKNQGPETVDLELQFVPKFNNTIFSYETDSLIQSTTEDTLIFTRSDFLLSNFKLMADDGSIIKFENTFAFVKGSSPDTIKLPLSIPSGNYVGLSLSLIHI